MATINATSTKVYSNFIHQALTKQVDLANDVIKCALVGASYTPNQSTHVYKNVSVTGELSGTNYVAGTGLTLGKTITAPTTLTTTFTPSQYVSGSAITVTGIRYLVIYDDTPATNKPLIAYADLGTATDCDGTLTINWNASGLFTITVA